MIDYAGLATEAAALLAEFGAQATLTRATPGAYNPSTGTVATTSAAQTVTACVFPYADKFVDGTNILSSDRQAFIAAPGVTAPRAGDVLTWGAETLTVVKVKGIAPGRTAVLYEAHVRNA